MIPFAVAPDPNSVVAGWIPLVLTLALGFVMFLLYRSLRKQMRKIDIPEEGIPTRREPRQDSAARSARPASASVDGKTPEPRS
ncbi:hypothetical protein [Granulicoccus sp. GXG6511]|uniref:hypothetical protein n=1 Tax=Granulicoccus sp. GXG6511 TaxID=3381351 RepID=UPI003D7D9EDF